MTKTTKVPKPGTGSRSATHAVTKTGRSGTKKGAASGKVVVDLLVGDVKPTMLRANPEEMAKAKVFLGYKSNQEMFVDLVQKAVDDKAFREERVRAQREALALLDDLDLTDLAEVTRFRPVERTE